MGNYKVKVGSEVESKEVQELFFELGYKWFSGGNQVQHLKQSCSSSFGYLVAWSTGCFTNVIQCGCGDEDAKELTTPQLKDMVVLKRNDVGDANTYCNDNSEHYYISSDGKYFYYLEGYESSKWMHSSNHISYLEKHVKPIEKPMKEFLNKLEDGTYKLVVLDSVADGVKGLIEVPDGADSFRVFYVAPDGGEFYKENSAMYFDKNYNRWSGVSRSIETLNTHSRTVWQRETQTETLPFIDDEPKYDPEDIGIAKGCDLDELAKECKFRDRYDGETDENYRAMLEQYIPEETLNDKVASAEVARQEFITPFDTQINGDHYKLLPIQPMKFALANGLDYAQGNVIKYVIRHASKNGKDDLLKAIHNIELMIEHYYG